MRRLVALLLLATAAFAAERPNFVVILADDLGYGDLGAYGSKTNRTPNLDRLAREGVRFTDFHSNGPMCSPTRAALLTGLYQHRFGREFEGALSGQTQYDHGLPLEAFTTAEMLGEAGYATAMYGKWHLGYHPPHMPANQGFDDFRGLAGGDGDHHSHIDRSGRPDWWHNNELDFEAGYTAELLTDHTVDFIRENRDGPFFVYLAHLAIHFPWQGPDDEGYRVEGQGYWDLSKLGRLDSKRVAPKTKQMIEAVDKSVGRVVAALEEMGLAENTLVVFTSDNGGYLTYQGGYHDISSNGPLRGQKTDVYEGGHRVPAIAWRPGSIEGRTSDALAATFDVMPTLAELAGIEAPRSDGVSLVAHLEKGDPLPARPMFWRMRGDAAVRDGRWKLVKLGENDPELYDLEADIGEQRDLAAEKPGKVRELLAMLAEWEADVDSGWR